MELYQVRYFLALCDTLNFTRAAERCNVSQPSLTRAIQNLEAEFGGPLFHRERQRTHLTELGRLMQPYFEQVARQAEAAKSLARSFAKLENIALKVGVMCTIGPSMLVELFERFRLRYPEIEIELTDAPGGALSSMLLDGSIDVALFGLPEGLDERLHGLPLFHERFVVAIGPEHRFAGQDVVRCRDLHEESYVNRVKCEFGAYAGDILREQGVEVKVVLRSDRDDWVQAMILAGLGFGFFPEFAVSWQGIQTRRLVEPEMSRTICLVTVRGRPHSPAVGAFVRTARSMQWPASRSGAETRIVEGVRASE